MHILSVNTQFICTRCETGQKSKGFLKLVLLFPIDIVFNVCELPDGNFLNRSQYYTYLNIPLRMPPFLSLGFFFFDFL
jgi:hypothetical protein